MCLKEAKKFLSEMPIYNQDTLNEHVIYGEYSTQGTLLTPPHPTCPFCDFKFYNDEFLFKHMNELHFICQLCKDKKNIIFYKEISQLVDHYQFRHHVCPYQECKDDMFVVFDTEDKLTSHLMTKHNCKDAQHKLTNFIYEEKESGGGSKKGKKDYYNLKPTNLVRNAKTEFNFTEAVNEMKERVKDYSENYLKNKSRYEKQQEEVHYTNTHGNKGGRNDDYNKYYKKGGQGNRFDGYDNFDNNFSNNNSNNNYNNQQQYSDQQYYPQNNQQNQSQLGNKKKKAKNANDLFEIAIEEEQEKYQQRQTQDTRHWKNKAKHQPYGMSQPAYEEEAYYPKGGNRRGDNRDSQTYQVVNYDYNNNNSSNNNNNNNYNNSYNEPNYSNEPSYSNKSQKSQHQQQSKSISSKPVKIDYSFIFSTCAKIIKEHIIERLKGESEEDFIIPKETLFQLIIIVDKLESQKLLELTSLANFIDLEHYKELKKAISEGHCEKYQIVNILQHLEIKKVLLVHKYLQIASKKVDGLFYKLGIFLFKMLI